MSNQLHESISCVHLLKCAVCVVHTAAVYVERLKSVLWMLYADLQGLWRLLTASAVHDSVTVRCSQTRP